MKISWCIIICRDWLKLLCGELCRCYITAILASISLEISDVKSAINAFTPSALSTVLLCAAKHKDCDYASIYAALRRHLSTSHGDRHYFENHGWAPHLSLDLPPFSSVRQFLSFCVISFCNSLKLTQFPTKLTSFTVPYFSLTDDPPAVDFAPLFPSGVFGINGTGKKYIREEKFTLSWCGGWSIDEPSLVVLLNPLDPYWTGGQHFEALTWVRNNFLLIAHKWEEILDSLDEQTTLSVRDFRFGFITYSLYWSHLPLADQITGLHNLQQRYTAGYSLWGSELHQFQEVLLGTSVAPAFRGTHRGFPAHYPWYL